MKTPILGGTYVARSVNAACSRMVNLFPEAIPEGGKTSAFLTRCPGLKFLTTAGIGPIRGQWVAKGNLYVVSGEKFYKIDSSYNIAYIGDVNDGADPVSMADNGVQIFIACNGPSYIYTIADNSLIQITDVDFPGAVTVAYIDGYFVFNEPNSQRFWVTALLDGTDIDALEFASAEGSTDDLVSLIVDHNEVWLFGQNSVEVWYDAATPDFPLQRIQGAYNELGCAAAFSVAKLDNSLFWLGADTRGKGVIYKANGYTGQRVSTHDVEWHIQQYETLSDAVAYTYQQDGHAFYVLNFPSADKTWVYDAATDEWHERAGFDNGQFVRHRGNSQATFNGEIVIGDFENGNLYTYDLDYYQDNGQIQKWLRSWRALPPDQNDLNRTTHHKLQLDMETGVGLITGQGENPEVMLRWSDDGGHTWSNEHWSSAGRIGEYGYRAIWRRLGMTLRGRDRVYEVSGTDPVRTYIMGAELSLSPTGA